jgi:hypothetical protein
MSISVVQHTTTAAIRRATETVATVLDVTSRGPQPWVQFSPFYPHGGIPVPLSPGRVTVSVEGAWQGLKVFERADIDLTKLTRADMRNLKRSTRSCGRMLGHRAGIGSTTLLSYLDARKQIYLPLYRWVLDHHLQALVADLRDRSARGPVILLDYTTNSNVDDPSSPLSHAHLIRRNLEGDWPG